MLGEGEVIATIAVSDIEKAKQFYGETLGLNQVDENPGGVIYKSGSSSLLVYPSGSAGTNKATYAGWKVDDVKAAVDELKGKGVEFETYPDLPMTRWDGEVATMTDGSDWQGAWFKDPDGNILSLGNM